ncbi:HD domain-containing protein [Ammoniphilus sp. 3BR4]|uniref:HD domain-containing protein n=1 Tax=Ammoniphilus sp. 3BR4 TaxID=3158265 RepID=UPI0034679D1A
MPDKISSALEKMITKYHSDQAHVEYVSHLAQHLFTSLQTLHKLDEIHLKYVTLAAYLHDIGHFIGKREHHEHSRYLIMHDRFLNDLEEKERRTVGLIVLNHRKPEILDLDSCDQDLQELQSLISILRIADVLDYEHKQSTKIKSVQYDPEQQTVVIDINWKNFMKYEKKIQKKIQWAANSWQVTLVVRSKKDQIIISPVLQPVMEVL